VNVSNSNTPKSERLTEMRPKIQWIDIDWKKVTQSINRLQTRITKAVLEGKWQLVKRLQYLLTHSFHAKLLAVNKICQNKGKRTAGIDGEKWLTSKAKMNAALNLSDESYKAKPLKRVFIEKPGKKKKRPLGIPTMHDRAMQALYALALDPIAEATADIASFGFRKFRSAQDACEQAFNCLCRRTSAQWVLEGDIKGCFDNINHLWLLDNIPMDKSILKQFLKAGFVYKHHLNPTKAGTPQGGIISPILANHYTSYCTSSLLSVTFTILDRQVGLLCFDHLMGRFSPGSSYSTIPLSLYGLHFKNPTFLQFFTVLGCTPIRSASS